MKLFHGDCREVLAGLEAESVHAVLTDPPYDLTSIQERFGKPGSAECQFGRDGAFSRLSRGFMGAAWDGTQVAFDPETWRAVWRVLKPGAWLLAFGGTRTSHRQTCAIEDAGFEIRDTIHWTYFTGFPKGTDVGKGIDRQQGAARVVVGTYRTPDGRDYTQEPNGKKPRFDGWHGEARSEEVLSGEGARRVTAPATPEAAAWDGWNVALKPSHEPILLARKPLSESSVAANVLRHGTGALNVEAARLERATGDVPGWHKSGADGSNGYQGSDTFRIRSMSPEEIQARCSGGRWPANSVFGHGPECGPTGCQEGCPVGILDAMAGERKAGHYPKARGASGYSGGWNGQDDLQAARIECDSVARYFACFDYEPPFYPCPKPTRRERDAGLGADFPLREVPHGGHGNGEEDPLTRKMRGSPLRNTHPCCKPVNLLRYLARLCVPPGGTILDPFMGSGSTGVAAVLEGFDFLGIELDAEDAGFMEIAEARIAHAARQAERGRPLLAKTRSLKGEAPGQGSLFDPDPRTPAGAAGEE